MKKKFTLKNATLVAIPALLIFFMLSGPENRPTGFIIEAKAIANQDDTGKSPWVLDIEKATLENRHYRSTKWTGQQMQMVLMSVKPGEEIDLEMHGDVDQFIRIEQGQAKVLMGKTEKNLTYNKTVSDNWAIFIPAGYYHNIKNTGKSDLKLYTIYAPAEHARGTVHKTYQEARKSHEDHH